jgi:hypothetical protein
MVYLKKLWYWITYPYTWWKEEREFKKRIKEMQEKDPFIYK